MVSINFHSHANPFNFFLYIFIKLVEIAVSSFNQRMVSHAAYMLSRYHNHHQRNVLFWLCSPVEGCSAFFPPFLLSVVTSPKRLFPRTLEGESSGGVQHAREIF
jgi:hypothetical protein